MEIYNQYFYVYDKELAKHLRYDIGINFYCTGLNVKTHDQFWQFPKSAELYQAVKSFMDARKQDLRHSLDKVETGNR